MRASVIIVAYNSRHDLPRCLAAVLSDAGPDDEVLVVDNGSTDGSADLVAAGFPQVRLIRSTNTGYAGGNNRGAAAARGDYLVFLNPDTIVEPGALAGLIAPLAAGEAGLTTACVVYLDQPQTVNACGNTMHLSGLTYCRGAGEPRAPYARPAEVDAVSGAAFAIGRALFAALGGFDERFFMYVEDSDLSLRARLAGQRCLYVPGAVVRHNYRPGFSPEKVFWLDRNRHLMLLSNLRRGAYLRLLPALLLAELVTWGFMLLRGPRYWPVKARVYSWLWSQRRSIRAARRAPPCPPPAELALIGRLARRLAFAGMASPAIVAPAQLLFAAGFALAGLPLRHAPRPGAPSAPCRAQKPPAQPSS